MPSGARATIGACFRRASNSCFELIGAAPSCLSPLLPGLSCARHGHEADGRHSEVGSLGCRIAPARARRRTQCDPQGISRTEVWVRSGAPRGHRQEGRRPLRQCRAGCAETTEDVGRGAEADQRRTEEALGGPEGREGVVTLADRNLRVTLHPAMFAHIFKLAGAR